MSAGPATGAPSRLPIYQRLVENSPAHVAVLDRRYVYQMVNAAFLRDRKLKPSDVIGHTAREVLGPKMYSQVRLPLQECFAGNVARREEWSQTPWAGMRYLERNHYPIAGQDGRVELAVVEIRDLTAARQAQDALWQSELRFRRLVEADIIGVISGQDGSITYANDIFLKMVGYTREDLQAGRMNWKKMTRPKYAPLDSRCTRQMFRRGCGEPFEKEYVRKDGTSVPILIGVAMLSRSPFRWIAFVMDLTERKKAERALRQAHQELERKVRERTADLGVANRQLIRENAQRRQAERLLLENQGRLRAILDTIPDAAWLRGVNGRYQVVNAAWCNVRGFKSDQVEGKTVWDIYPRKDARLFARQDRQMRRDRKPVQFEQSLRTWDGRAVWLDVVKGAVLGPGGKVIGIAGIARDITAHKKAQDALRESEEKYRQLFNMETDAVVLADARTRRFVDVNQSACRMYGYSRPEFLRLRQLAVSAQPQVSARFLARTLREGRAVVTLRYHKRKDGTAFPVEISASSFMLQGRKVICAAVRDISGRVAAQEALRSAQSQMVLAREQERRRLAGELHDSVGQKLFAAGLRLKTIGQKISASQSAAALEALGELSWQLQGLSDEVRRVSRDLYPPALDVLGLPAALRQLKTDLAMETTQITVRCPDQMETNRLPEAVEIELYRIAQEATSNAIRHGRPQNVELSLSRSHGQVRLRILDDGVGFVVNDSRGGLGLASMRERADAVGAALHIASRPGRTCVEVRVDEASLTAALNGESRPLS